MDTKSIINQFIKAWEENEYVDFTEIFADGALIYHPYFEHPISASESMEVMNTAVSGSSTMENYELIDGDGSGANDRVRLEIFDTGEQVKDACYIGVLPVYVNVRKGKITSIAVEKGTIKKIRDKQSPRKLFRRKTKITNCFDGGSTLAIAIKLAKFWGQNYEEEFRDLFCLNAKVKHILYLEEASPEVVVDVMNSNVLGTTELFGFEILSGNGAGEKDTACLKFIETGDQIGYVPDVQGVMKIWLEIKNHRISYLDVLGYDIVNIGRGTTRPV
ncbi:MAG: hypothetical protein LBV33_00540 [Lachnospiraceae bacterium]|jgi:hypothetical protein|nr:hypothetical protein [Lachnospiraceae bacterium]